MLPCSGCPSAAVVRRSTRAAVALVPRRVALASRASYPFRLHVCMICLACLRVLPSFYLWVLILSSSAKFTVWVEIPVVP